MSQTDQHADQHTDPELDRIDRSIDIDAGAEKVWALVARPGWWINEGDVEPDPAVRTEGDLTFLTHPKWGEFRLRTVEQDPPRYVAYRWMEQDNPDAGTLVEFRIEDRDGGVTLRVSESGFTQLGKERDAVISHVQQNTDGWEAELAAARRFVTADAS